MPALPTIVLLDQDFEGTDTVTIESPPEFNEALGRGDYVVYTLRVTRPSDTAMTVELKHKFGNDNQYFPGSFTALAAVGLSTAPYETAKDTGATKLGRYAKAELTFYEDSTAIAGHVLLIACPRTS